MSRLQKQPGACVFPEDHPIIAKKTGNMQQDLKLEISMLPVQLLYYALPEKCTRQRCAHKIMRAVALNAQDMGDVNGVFSCCDCGICTLFACNFSLAPSRMMKRVKEGFGKQGIRPVKRVAREPSDSIENIKLPVSRLMARLGIDKYDRDLELVEDFPRVENVRIPLKMHIGAAAKPVS